MGFSLGSLDPIGSSLHGPGRVPDPFDIYGHKAAEEARRQRQMIEDAKAEEARKAGLRRSINQLYGVGDDADPSLAPARAGFEAEETDLGRALRGYYGDDQQRRYETGRRETGFALANRGQVGGSVMADTLADLEEKNRTGGTRIEEAVQRAFNSLRSSREQSRLGALSLVNAGQGEEGVRSASAGLKTSLEAAKSANREDLFTDLFANTASAKLKSDARARDAELAVLMRGGGRRSLLDTETSSRPQVFNTNFE